MDISPENDDQQAAENSGREERKNTLAKAIKAVEQAQDAVVVGTELHRAQRASDGPSDEQISSLNRAEDQDLYNLESAAGLAAKDVRIKRNQVDDVHKR